MSPYMNVLNLSAVLHKGVLSVHRLCMHCTTSVHSGHLSTCGRQVLGWKWPMLHIMLFGSVDDVVTLMITCIECNAGTCRCIQSHCHGESCNPGARHSQHVQARHTQTQYTSAIHCMHCMHEHGEYTTEEVCSQPHEVAPQCCMPLISQQEGVLPWLCQLKPHKDTTQKLGGVHRTLHCIECNHDDD